MRTIADFLSRLPIKWKLTFLSSLLICVLFLAYNFAQYLVITQWMMTQEQNRIQAAIGEIQTHFGKQDATLTADRMLEDQAFLEKLNRENQFIRILNAKGQPVLQAAADLPFDWVAPKTVETPQSLEAWHLEDHLLVMRAPIAAGNFADTVEIAVHLEPIDQFNAKVFVVFAAGGIGAVLLSGIGGMLIARQLLKPLQSVTEAMRKIKHTGLEARVETTPRKDEISDLALIFNRMMDQLESSFRQQKRFVEDASHELRTPIAIMEGHLSLLNRWGKHDPAVLDESLAVSLQEVSRLKTLVGELLELSQAESAFDPEGIPLIEPAGVALETVNEFAFLHPDFTFETKLEGLAGTRIAVRERHLKQLLLILLDNAVKYSADRKLVEIQGNAEGGDIEMQVTDYGLGIPAQDLPFIFDRFYRADKARSRMQGGSGLGLSIAKRLAGNYGGTVTAESGGAGGTRFTLRFPAALPSHYI